MCIYIYISLSLYIYIYLSISLSLSLYIYIYICQPLTALGSAEPQHDGEGDAGSRQHVIRPVHLLSN